MSGFSPGACGQCRRDDVRRGQELLESDVAEVRRGSVAGIGVRVETRAPACPCPARTSSPASRSSPCPSRRGSCPPAPFPGGAPIRPLSVRASPKETERRSESMSAIVSSATPRAFAPSARSTLIPRLSQAARSIESTPVPFRLMAFRQSARASTASVIFSTPASHPAQPGHQSKQLLLVRVLFPACRTRAGGRPFSRGPGHGSPPFVRERGVTRIFAIGSVPLARPSLGRISTLPARLNTRRGNPSFSMSP